MKQYVLEIKLAGRLLSSNIISEQDAMDFAMAVGMSWPASASSKMVRSVEFYMAVHTPYKGPMVGIDIPQL